MSWPIMWLIGVRPLFISSPLACPCQPVRPVGTSQSKVQCASRATSMGAHYVEPTPIACVFLARCVGPAVGGQPGAHPGSSTTTWHVELEPLLSCSKRDVDAARHGQSNTYLPTQSPYPPCHPHPVHPSNPSIHLLRLKPLCLLLLLLLLAVLLPH